MQTHVERADRYDLNASTERIALRSPPPTGAFSSPSVDLDDVLRVFLPNEANGYPRSLRAADMTLEAFFKRAAAVLPNLLPAQSDGLLRLIDPRETVQPSAVFG